MAFESEQQGLALHHHSSDASGDYAYKGWGTGKPNQAFSLQASQHLCMLSSLLNKKSSDLPLLEQNLLFDHIKLTQFSRLAQWSIGDTREREGGKDQKGKKLLKPEHNSSWHDLYLDFSILPATFSFYNQNSGKHCGVALLINFID